MDKELDKASTLAEMPNYIKAVYKREWLALFLEGVCRFSTMFTALVFALVLLGCAVGNTVLMLELAVVTLVPFIGVSVFRSAFAAPRPRELYDMSSLGELEPKKSGRSFPSRHVFSSFVIGTALCFVEPVLGAVVLFLGITLGACRVLLGYHFLRDVVAGGLIGAVCGIIGMLIVNIG